MVDQVLQSRQKRVLVVDDSPTIVKILKQGLTQLGYEVMTAGDGVEALEILADVPIDLMLTDINMPNMDGYELVVRTRAQAQFSVMPIIVLTSVADRNVMRKSLDAGANLYLTKPAPMPKLRYKVQSLLGDVSSVSQTEAALSAVARSEVQAHLEEGAKEKERRKRAQSMSAEMHVEMYLYAENDAEADDILQDFEFRNDIDAFQVLPLLLEELEPAAMRRLFRLMAFMKQEEFVLPLIHRFREVHTIELQKELVWAIGSCGKREYLPEIRQLHNRLIEGSGGKDDDYFELLDTVDQVIDAIENERTTQRLHTKKKLPRPE